ncbi:bifunctional hydroxymethylpyrimidine kinase/phosphomethylpyrimidine kinase [Bowdeniella nasicola]|uniref:Bifunctional hydroxymethylpyrimidine kinase/phosphomethylpyrimidine kinase n=1 Tax=Bowdeniella nasicola TaxID=208480 RepID=A0A1Q5Q014_9ACTO|nr:bifunctional hydroxymethylpyrimidine kinase/phosphomethylpyrimidine kinase [Bowdeniella nasicola]
MHPVVWQRPPRVLSIAGSDPSGGAGIQADLKSITAAGGYGMTAITALTVQNTQGVRDVHAPSHEFLTAQLEALSDDIDIDGVKTGMLATAQIIEAVATWLEAHPVPVLVVDPVMVATSGDRLLDEDAEEAMRDFCRRATVVTPNIGELAVLTGQSPAQNVEQVLEQARSWSAETGVAVVVKTGHLAGIADATNYLVSPDGTTHAAPTARIETSATHGTGCSLSSALATRLAAGDDPEIALEWASQWLNEAIAHAESLGVGKGHGPVDHSRRARRLSAAANTRPWFEPLPGELHTPDDLPRAAHTSPPRAVPVAGPWTQALWEAGWPTWQAITECRFVDGLVSGTLPGDQFAFYLGQDALYLSDYSRALAALAARSTNAHHGTFWAEGSAGVILVERELHRTWLKGVFPGEQGPVTSHYTSFLLASTLGENYAVGAASVLPCYWLYAEAGALIPPVGDDHPYAAWLRTYQDPAFTDAARRAVEIVEETLDGASPADRSRAARAHLMTTRHELEFFEQATRLLPAVTLP